MKADEDARRGLKVVIGNLNLESGLRELALRKIPKDMSEIITKTAQKVEWFLFHTSLFFLYIKLGFLIKVRVKVFSSH